MSESRKLAAILVSDVVGFSRLAGADEERLLARLRALRSDLIDPTIAVHKGRVVKRTGDGAIVEFRSVVDAVRCAIEVQNAMVERNAGVPEDRRIVFRIGVHVGDVVEESDGDLMGDGVNIAARLEGVAAPGAICLSEDAYRQVKSRLDLAVTDMGETKLKNIAEPIRTYSLQVGAPAASKAAAPATKSAAPEKPSIAALPFQNMSGDAEQDYFVDGLVEDIITGLSRVKSLTVIARNSSFVYKGKAVDIRQVGRDLGVRYVLEGSVRKGGSKLRITAQLIEAETGAHIWADRFEGALDDVFDLQDQVTERVVGVIEPSVRKSEIERSRRKRPDSLDAYDLYLRAWPHLNSTTPEDANEAIRLLLEALKLDPRYGAAHGSLAWAYEMRFVFGGHRPEDATASVHHAREALTHGGDDAAALAAASIALFNISGDFAAASDAIDRALQLNPACATALYNGAYLHAAAGDKALALDYANRALRLSPFDAHAWLGHLARGNVALRERACEAAASHYGRMVQANPRFLGGLLLQTWALSLAGRSAEAAQAAQSLLALDPNFSQKPFLEQFGRLCSPEFNFPELGRVGKQAGLPD